MAERTGQPLARDAMAYVLAGGRGSRLKELTDSRAKPAVYFGGKTRIIDFALSNAIKDFGGGVVMISHCHEFYAPLCNEEWHVANGKLSVKGEAADKELKVGKKKRESKSKAVEKTTGSVNEEIKIVVPKDFWGKSLSKKDARSYEKAAKKRDVALMRKILQVPKGKTMPGAPELGSARGELGPRVGWRFGHESLHPLPHGRMAWRVGLPSHGDVRRGRAGPKRRVPHGRLLPRARGPRPGQASVPDRVPARLRFGHSRGRVFPLRQAGLRIVLQPLRRRHCGV